MHGSLKIKFLRILILAMTACGNLLGAENKLILTDINFTAWCEDQIKFHVKFSAHSFSICLLNNHVIKCKII